MPMWTSLNTKSELVEKNRNFLDGDRHVSLKTIIIQFGIGVTAVHRIIYGDLNMRKICSRGAQWRTERKTHWWQQGDGWWSSNCLSPTLQSRQYCLWLLVVLQTEEESQGQPFWRDWKDVTRVPDIFTLDDCHGAFTQCLERYNKSIEVRGFYFEGC